jgi:hypothetical protein
MFYYNAGMFSYKEKLMEGINTVLAMVALFFVIIVLIYVTLTSGD